MEYLYLAMFLKEVKAEINEMNIEKIYDALELAIDKEKLSFFIPALAILTDRNIKKENEKPINDTSITKQLVNLQNRFENLKDAITKVDDRVEQIDMKPNQTAHHEEIKKAASDKGLPARYVYAIADKGVKESFGNIGINGTEVYTIPYKEMCIVVHDCSDQPYQSDNDDEVKNWLFTQQEVLDVIADRFGVVLPMSFDMIIEGKDGNDPEEEVKAWLEENYNEFDKKIAKLRNKQEYGIQVIIDTDEVSKILIDTDEKLRAKKKDIETKPQGLAYMEKEILKDMLKEKLEESADEYFREFYSIVKKCVDDIVIGKTKKVGGNKQMIMNLSCLVHKSRVEELGSELEKIQQKPGVSVRFSGPWAPFSFVTPEKGGEE